jgi:hypothetical protein
MKKSQATITLEWLDESQPPLLRIARAYRAAHAQVPAHHARREPSRLASHILASPVRTKKKAI